MQGEWAIEELALSGENVQGAGFEDIPGFISAWNNAGINQYELDPCPAKFKQVFLHAVGDRPQRSQRSQTENCI